MTRIGFEDGGTVTVSITKDNRTKGPVTVSAWRQNDNGKLGEIVISVKREPEGTIAAPEPIRLHATVTSATGLPVYQNGDVTPDAMYDYDVKGDGSVIWEWDQQLHELEFVWTIHSGTSGTFDKVSRLPSQWRAKNKIYGPYADFMLETAGDHDVTCEVYRTDYNGGTQTSTLLARKTITISDVLDPDVLYAGNRTCVVDEDLFPNGGQEYENAHLTDADAPTGSVGVKNMWNALNTYQKPADGICRILFKRGKDHVGTSQGIRDGSATLTFGAYGSGSNRPVLRQWPGANSELLWAQRSNQKESFGYWKFEGLHFQGLWDEKTELEPGNKPLLKATSPGQLIAYDCTAAGIDRLGLMQQVEGEANGGIGEAGESAFWLYDSYVTGFQNYGLFMASQWLDIILVGSGVRRASDATMNVPEGKASTIGGQEVEPSNRHGPLRALKFARLAARATDWFNRSGWVGNPQPCWRVGTHNSNAHSLYGDLKWGNWVMQVHHSVFEGGANCVITSTEANSNPILPANILFKHNIGIYDIGTGGFFGVARGGTSFIENIAVAAAVARSEYDDSTNSLKENSRRGNFWGFALNDNNETGNPAINRAWPMHFRGNLCIDDKTPWNESDELLMPDLSENWRGRIEQRDNYVWAPNYDTPQMAIGSLEAAFTVASYNTYGARYRRAYEADPANRIYDEFTSHPAQGTTLITPGGQITVRRPATGDAAISGATGAMSRVDLLGNERPPDAASTPLEPAF